MLDRSVRYLSSHGRPNISHKRGKDVIDRFACIENGGNSVIGEYVGCDLLEDVFGGEKAEYATCVTYRVQEPVLASMTCEVIVETREHRTQFLG